jgi:hypothetical protein
LFFLPQAQEGIEESSFALWQALMEEKFFFLYYLQAGPEVSMTLPINERKWIIERYVKQKKKETTPKPKKFKR